MKVSRLCQSVSVRRLCRGCVEAVKDKPDHGTWDADVTHASEALAPQRSTQPRGVATSAVMRKHPPATAVQPAGHAAIALGARKVIKSGASREPTWTHESALSGIYYMILHACTPIYRGHTHEFTRVPLQSRLECTKVVGRRSYLANTQL